MNRLHTPNYYKKEVQKRQENDILMSKDRVLNFLGRIHKELYNINKWELPFTLTFSRVESDTPDIYEKDIPFLIDEADKLSWTIDPNSIRWHIWEGIKDGILSLKIRPAEEINVTD